MFWLKIKAALRKIYILLYNFFMARRAKKSNKSSKTQNLPVNNYFVHKIVAFFITLLLFAGGYFYINLNYVPKINV